MGNDNKRLIIRRGDPLDPAHLASGKRGGWPANTASRSVKPNAYDKKRQTTGPGVGRSCPDEITLDRHDRGDSGDKFVSSAALSIGKVKSEICSLVRGEVR